MKVGDLAYVDNQMVYNNVHRGFGIITELDYCEVFNRNTVWVLLSTGQHDWFYEEDIVTHEGNNESNVESCF